MSSSAVGLTGTKVFKGLAAAALALAFLAVVPLHQHADAAVHDGDCSVCSVAHNALFPDAGSVPAVLFILLFAVILSEAVILPSRQTISYLRGPPAF